MVWSKQVATTWSSCTGESLIAAALWEGAIDRVGVRALSTEGDIYTHYLSDGVGVGRETV